jgi:serine/threonine-protein kinase
MAPRILAAGTMLSGRYRLAEAIGESDLSRVYAAEDVGGRGQVALKVFDQAVTSRAAALSEYQTQARQASGLGVEGIARAYDFGIDANAGVPFSTAERISWASLDRRVLQHGPLGVSDLSRALAVVARALDAAHLAQLVHRDLKPQNVFISPDNPEWVRITDFGVSAVRRGAAEAMGWGGPPGYTPPEAVDAGATSTPAVDLFALGVVAFFALTRGTPFRSLRSQSFDANAHWAELNQPLSPISERAREIGVALDPALDAWFARALALAPQERFQSAGEMAREFDVASELVAARGGGGPRTMPGIAAAIAQPLVFQPEPSPASLGLPYAPTAPGPTASRVEVSAPSPAQASPATAEDSVPPPKKSSNLPLLAGLGGVLLVGLAGGSYALLGRSENGDAGKVSAEASAAPAAASAAPPAAPPPAAPPPASPPPVAVSAAPSGPARVLFKCEPQTCEWIVCDGKNLTGFSAELTIAPGLHECSASRFGFGSKSLTFTATAGELSTVVFDLPPLPAKASPAAPAAVAAAPATPLAKAAAPASKAAPTSKPAATAPAKPAAAKSIATPATKASASAATKSKKKCSTFLGCK